MLNYVKYNSFRTKKKKKKLRVRFVIIYLLKKQFKPQFTKICILIDLNLQLSIHIVNTFEFLFFPSGKS